MKKRNRFAILLAVALMATSAVACRGGENSSGGKTPFEYTQEVRPSLVIGSTELNLTVGDTFTVKYALKNCDDAVAFTSRNPSVATVDADGNVTAMNIGQTIITLRAGEILRNINVFVEAAPTFSIVNFDHDVELIIGKSYKLSTALYKGNDQVEATFAYQSKNADVATVNGEGVISAVGTGACEILITCEKNGKTYQESILVQCHELCYIDAENFNVNYGEETTVPYTVRNANGEAIDGAVVSVSAGPSITANGDKITASNFGTSSITLDYYGVKKTVEVTSSFKLEKDEFNYFGHGITVQNASAYDFYHFQQSAYMASYALQDSVGDKTSEKGKYLAVHSTQTNGYSCKYMGIYFNCRQSKEQLEALLAEGYTKIKFSYMIESESTIANYVIFPWTTNQNHTVPVANYGAWYEKSLPLQDYINNYEALNTFNVESPSKDNPLQFLRTSIEDSKVPYTVYISPVQIVK